MTKKSKKRKKKGLRPNERMFEKMLKRLTKVYIKSGGTITKEEDETIGLSVFDALKILISKKLKIIRKTLSEIQKVTNVSVKIQKKNDVRLMIEHTEKDFKKLQNNYENRKKNLLFRKKDDDKILNAQKEEMELIKVHMIEIKMLSKRKYTSKRRNSKKRNNMKDLMKKKEGKKTENKTEEIIIIDEDENYDKTKYVIELQDDPNETKLPCIQIEKSMQKIKDNKEKLQAYLKIFLNKVKDIKQNAIDMGNQIDYSNKIISNVDKKIEQSSHKIKVLNKRIKKK